jgi:copper(I)-binding protein
VTVRCARAAALLVLLAAACAASEPRIAARGAWARATLAAAAEEAPPPASPGVVYLVLTNEGGRADRLVSAATEVATVVELHETRVEGDRMRMVHLTEGAEIPAGGQLELRPGGMHLMLIDLARHLRAGESFPLTLRFAEAPAQTIEVEVRAP